MTRFPRRPHPLGDDAVSDVVGQLLMVAATVAIGGGFILILLSLPPPPEQGRVDVGAFILPRATDQLVLEHRGGDAIPFSDLQVAIVVGTTRSVVNVGDRLSASDPAWAATDAGGNAKTAQASWRAGDRVVYTSATLQGQGVRVEVADLDSRSAVLVPSVVQETDATPPTLASARTLSTTTVTATFSERLYNVSAADFTLTGLTISSARLVGLGDQAVLTTTTSFATSATPTLTVAAVPAGTYDLGGNRLTGSTAVVAADGVAPTITFSSSSATNTSLSIHFNTSETATPTILYGPTLVYGLTVSGASGTAHDVVIGSVTSGTTYHYRILAADAAGNNNTAEASRSQATAGGSGGTGTGTGANYFEWTTIVTPIDPGIVSSSTYTITLRDSTGAAVTPSNLEVRLGTNSTAGRFYDAAGTTPIDRVVLSTSTTTLRYYDARPMGVSVLTATANNTVPGTALVHITNRGNLVPKAGDSLESVMVNVLYPREEDRAEDPMLGVNVINPTPTAKTISGVTLWAHPGFAGFFQTTVTAGPGSDVSCSWTGAGTDQLSCSGLSYSLPAYGVMQLTVTFRTSNGASDSGTMLTANVSFSSPSGTVQSVPSKFVFHEGSSNSAIMVRILCSATSGGTERASFDLGTGGSAKNLYFEWQAVRAAGTSSLYERIHIPAGWSSVSVPVVPAGFGVHIDQPTATQSGLVEVSHSAPATGATQELNIVATPPAIDGVDQILIERTTAGGSVFDVWESTAVFGVKIGA